MTPSSMPLAGLETDPYHQLAFELLLKPGIREQEAVYLPWRHVAEVTQVNRQPLATRC